MEGFVCNTKSTYVSFLKVLSGSRKNQLHPEGQDVGTQRQYPGQHCTASPAKGLTVMRQVFRKQWRPVKVTGPGEALGQLDRLQGQAKARLVCHPVKWCSDVLKLECKWKLHLIECSNQNTQSNCISNMFLFFFMICCNNIMMMDIMPLLSTGKECIGCNYLKTIALLQVLFIWYLVL